MPERVSNPTFEAIRALLQPYEKHFSRKHLSEGPNYYDLQDERDHAITTFVDLYPWKGGARLSLYALASFPGLAAELPPAIAGIKEANAARLRVEEQIRQETEHANRAKSDAEEAKVRKKWPPEGTRPIKVARVISKSIIGGKHRLTAPVGGEGGVREGWTVEVPTTIEPSEIKELELRPPTK